MHILVTELQGTIGRRLATVLATSGHSVTALVRLGSKGSGLFHKNINTVYGDITVAESIQPFMAGVDCVLHAAGVKTAARRQTLNRVNVSGTKHLADLAVTAGVKRFVYVSSIAAQGHPS